LPYVNLKIRSAKVKGFAGFAKASFDEFLRIGLRKPILRGYLSNFQRFLHRGNQNLFGVPTAELKKNMVVGHAAHKADQQLTPWRLQKRSLDGLNCQSIY